MPLSDRFRPYGPPLRAYVSAVFSHWKWLTFWVLAEVVGNVQVVFTSFALPAWLWVTIAIVGLFVAQFLAYADLHRAHAELTSGVDADSQEKLAIINDTLSHSVIEYAQLIEKLDDRSPAPEHLRTTEEHRDRLEDSIAETLARVGTDTATIGLWKSLSIDTSHIHHDSGRWPLRVIQEQMRAKLTRLETIIAERRESLR